MYKLLFSSKIILIAIIINLIASLCFFIGGKLFDLSKEYELFINSDNEKTIEKYLDDYEITDGINNIISIRVHQELGDWSLYIKKKNKTSNVYIFNDGEAINLFEYVKTKGMLGGLLGRCFNFMYKVTLTLSTILVMIKILMGKKYRSE